MRRASRKDALHNAVGNIFRRAGFDCLDLSLVGSGCPDWLIARDELAFLIEVKTPAHMANRGGQLDEHGRNERQIAWHQSWRSRIYIVSSVEECWGLVDQYKPKGIATR